MCARAASCVPVTVIDCSGDADGLVSDDVTVRAKGQLDGCASLREVAGRLREVAAEYQRLADEGWELTRAVTNDHGWMALR